MPQAKAPIAIGRWHSVVSLFRPAWHLLCHRAQAELEVRGDVYTSDTLAWTFFRNGRIQDAVEAMSKALAQGTPEPAFHAHAAAIFEAAGRAEDARHHREQLAKLNSSVAEF